MFVEDILLYLTKKNYYQKKLLKLSVHGAKLTGTLMQCRSLYGSRRFQVEGQGLYLVPCLTLEPFWKTIVLQVEANKLWSFKQKRIY